MASRGLRSKRPSSPASLPGRATAPLSEPVARLKDGHRTFLDAWVEPPLRNSVPSFEDNKGLERVGVLEHMMPLGQPPTQKVLQKLKLYTPKVSQRASPSQPEEAATPTTEVDLLEPASPLPITRPESINTEDYEMKPASARGAPAKEQDDGKPPNGPSPASPVTNTTARVSGALNGVSLSTSSQRVAPAEAMRVYIEAAISEAERNNAPGLIPGLRRLLNDAAGDAGLCMVLDAVCHKATSRDQFRTFRNYIKNGVEEYRATAVSNSPSRSRHQMNTSQVATVPSKAAPSTSAPNASLKLPPTLPSTASITTVPNQSHGLDSMADSHQPTSAAVAAAIHAGAYAPGLANGGFDPHGSEPVPVALTQHKRSRSASSSSSLSSAKSLDPEIFAPSIENEGDGKPSNSRSARSAGQRQATNRVAIGDQSNTRSRKPASTDPYSRFRSTNSFSNSRTKRQRADSDLDQGEIDRQKQVFHENIVGDSALGNRSESHDRSVVAPSNLAFSSSSRTIPPPVIHPHNVQPSPVLLSSPSDFTATAGHLLRNGTGRKRSRSEQEQDEDAIDTLASSSPAPLLAPPLHGLAESSRAGTPRSSRLPPTKKVKKSARVMVSPNKPRQGGITAGISRAGPSKDSGTGNGADDSEEENNEYCGACGGYGELLCCDGCPNAFHGTCLEPPMDTKHPPEVQWYCPRCVSRHWARGEEKGILGRVIRRVEEMNPKAFNLPFEIRDYFEGVKTGDEGEYEELSLPKTQNNQVKMNRAGFIEEPNYKELRDNKNHLIFCHRCSLTSNGRDIIPCDYCPARWHLDCLDPPLAVPPRRRKDNPNAAWRCPLHVDQDLSTMDRNDLAAPGDLGRMPRLRKPKNAIPYDVSLSRGFQNNGLIEVELMLDDEPDFKEVEMMGTVYRLPETGIRLDFLDRVKRSWYEDQTFGDLLHARKRVRTDKYRPSLAGFDVAQTVGRPHPSNSINTDQDVADLFPSNLREGRVGIVNDHANTALRARTFREQQTILTLQRLAQSHDRHHNSNSISSDSVGELVNALITEASPEASQAIQEGEREALLQLQDLLQRRLSFIQADDINHTVNGARAVSAHTD